MSTKGPYATMAAAGTTQATATEITAEFVMVTPTVSADGVLLPAKNLNDDVYVVNADSTHTLFVYPQTGGKLNNGTANDPLNMPPNTAARFRAISSLDWAVIF